jgi:hypothetical protein
MHPPLQRGNGPELGILPWEARRGSREPEIKLDTCTGWNRSAKVSAMLANGECSRIRSTIRCLVIAVTVIAQLPLLPYRIALTNLSTRPRVLEPGIQLG